MKRWIGISFVLGVLLGVGVVRSQQGAPERSGSCSSRMTM